MSEEINSSHLCTTEDAFEQFQAVSMYEEDEYITLSDIVPTETHAPDLTGEINDIPYEDEVVLESNPVDQVCEVNSTIESGCDGSEMSGPSDEHFISTTEVAEEIVVEQQNESSEAGLNDIPEAGLNGNTEAGHNDITIADHKNVTEEVPNAVIGDVAEPRTSRRGRKNRNVTADDLNNIKTNTNAQEHSQQVLNTPGQRRRGRPPKKVSRSLIEITPLNEDCQIENVVQNSTVKKRGRPRKSNMDQLLSEPTSSSEADCQDVNKNNGNVNDNDLSEVEVPENRVEHMKILSSEKSESDLNETKKMPDQNITDPVKKQYKSRSKRGRRKKRIACEIDFNGKHHEPSQTDLEAVKGENLDIKDDDDADDVCLSKLKTSLESHKPSISKENMCIETEKKEIIEPEVNEFTMEIEISEENGPTNDLTIAHDESKAKIPENNSSTPGMIDFEDDIDKIVSITTEQTRSENEPVENYTDPNSLLVEDTSKRPTRRRARKPLHYDEESDEDPFANVELSDDEPIGCKKKYYSDDEYIPGKNKKGKQSDSSESDSEMDIDTIEEELIENKRKRTYKKSEGSPTKGAKKSRKSINEKPLDNATAKVESEMNDDIEVCLKPTIIKTNEDRKKKDIENFLAKKIQGTDIKIKKKSTVQPFEIPVIDPKEQKKMTENSTQTNKVPTTSCGVQTISIHDIPMKENVMLTSEQSEKACEFLNSIVKTTAELGELMTQKSQDFMKKKINTDHVTDTFKMDYCVRKSFLLFKLAKHNLMQMEEDLAKQYDTFLSTQNLQKHREQPKVVTAVQKTEENDSDCEIIETSLIQKPQKKTQQKAFNPKTVFLNKELSIKIAKKSTAKNTKPEDKKINMKGRHTVWINDSVMVKKVKPTQSFLAQDSRNKKPPDYVTIEMVNSFFKQYYRQKAITACAPYVSIEWLTQKPSVCCYYFATADNIPVINGIPSGSSQCNVANGNLAESNNNLVEKTEQLSPKTLFSLCTQVLQNHLSKTIDQSNELMISRMHKFVNNPPSLYQLCVNTINVINLDHINDNVNCASLTTSLYQERVLNDANLALQDQEIDGFLSPSPLIDQEVEDSLCSSPLSLPEQGVNEEDHQVSPLIEQGDVDYNLDYALPLSLKTLCYKQIVKHMFTKDKMTKQETFTQNFDWDKFSFDGDSVNVLQIFLNYEIMHKSTRKNEIKSLFSLCFDLINFHMSEKTGLEKCIDYEKITEQNMQPNTLKYLTFKCIVDLMNTKRDSSNTKSQPLPKKVKSLCDLCFEIISKSFSDRKDSPPHESLTINSINTLTEEAYHNIRHEELTGNLDYYEDDDSTFYDDETETGINNFEDDNATADNWLSQVQMQELRSCYTPNPPQETETNLQEPTSNVVEAQPLIARVKTEPVEEFQENVDLIASVKSEPVSHNLDEMTIIPENVITKTEYDDAPAISRPPIQRQNSSSFDVDTFEAFVATNKMMHGFSEYHNDDEIFSQSALRVRRQFEPDDLSENDMGMSLLIPQTFEPLRIENNAKDCLMESSSDESTNSKKVLGKKKIEKRPRGKPKKNESKASTIKDPVVVTKDKPPVTNEIAILTRRMREKIRQEEKKIVSSESENESENIITKKSKQKAKTSKALEDHKVSHTTTEVEQTKPADDEIQCSNVDSTEQINDVRNLSPCVSNFTGFTAVDQNEISSYHKYVKYVYDQILPKEIEESDTNCKNSDDQPVINPQDPVELLECEPSMPYFPEEPKKIRRPGPKTKTQNLKEIKKAPPKDENEIKSNDGTEKHENFTERHGWNCYPINGNDTKLYQNAQILLEKLPESFVQTYLMYQDIATKDNEDDEVDRLINLQSLKRPAVKDGKSNKGKLKTINPDKISELLRDMNDRLGSISPTFSENADELTPSEDEDGRIEDELPPPVKPTSDNNLAKNLLMDDNDSEVDESGVSKIKDEPLDEYDNPIKFRSKKSKSKMKAAEEAAAGPVMLTADKMMNKELNLLHAPINLDDTIEPTPSKGRTSKHKQKSTSKTSPKENVKAEDDSSSEEEKHQWFTIKEKLLKRMVKKSDTTREDDAKRAKLVSEFIERRGDSSEAYIKRRGSHRGRRVSKKKMLERQKQLKVLSRELFGDPSNDASLHRKSSQQAYFKGRRNIRKVIDKKSLARSTVIANMEEFERKRRINMRQCRLREIMQCEDGVNVLVINDEVCLEYDFEEHRPVVTIHPFFTKVMKAHQYEGVKFMWDACFESLESIAAGHPGGGCILAHCMGLGKTLQVLALLHTVLTHPRVGMQRVLVCCPLSTVLNWVDEIHKWIGPVTNQIKVFELSKLKKTSNRAYQLEDWYTGGGIFIIGYELFRSLTTLDPVLDNVRPAVVNKIRTALLNPGPDIIICDEGHLLKNDCSVLAVAMSRVVTKRRIVLTGTPMQNNLREYYCMVNFVKPNLLGTYSEYSNRFENPIMNGQHRDSREEDIKLMKARTHILHKVLEGCLQRQEASVLYPYLPKKHEYTVFISLTQCQWDLYKHYLQNYSNTQNNKSVLKDFHILQKIWSHPQVLHNFQNRTGETTRNKVKEEKLEDDLAREDLNATEDIKQVDTEVWWLQYLEDGAMLDSLASSNKFVTVFRILEESIALNDKVLIFSTSLFTMDALEYFLKKINNWSLGQEYYRLDGSVPAEVRQKWCREFNAENNLKTKLFLISTRAGCLGLNMTAANRVIILDTSWNPAHDIQSIFRVYRFGQKKDCYIYRLVALGTMEQKIYERSVTKQAVACRVVDEQQIDRHYNMAELTELYKYDETGAGVAGGVAVGVEDVVLLRVARDAALHAVHEHDSLLRGSLEQGLPEHERDAAWVQFQEEHAHKQQMQDMVPLVKIKKVKVKMPVAPQPEPQLEPQLQLQPQPLEPQLQPQPQPPPAETAAPNWPPVKTETEETILPNDPEFTLDQLKPKSKGRKGRPAKSNVVSCCIPIQPEAPEADEPALTEEDMIKKITHILLKYNYQNNQGPKEIADLVSKVRSLVYSGKMDQLDSSDQLTMSIARVLLGREIRAPVPGPPPLTDIAENIRTEVVEPESIEKPAPRPRGRPRKEPEKTEDGGDREKQSADKPPRTRGRPRKSEVRASESGEKIRKGYVYEAVPSTSSRADPAPDDHGHRRRRAALAAEKNFESIGDPVVDLEDDDFNDNEFLPEINIDYDDAAADQDSDSSEIVFSNVEIKKEGDAEPFKRAPKKVKTYERKSQISEAATPTQESNESSILLSDDDDPPPALVARKKPGPLRKTIKTERIPSPAPSSTTSEVPLHPSLLSNKNFIKIVAHTYLSGNPMLDEDAATLAAQYSTFKALKEYEANGKHVDITSGPIYDIAVKVLGVDVLKKLHNSNVKINTSEIIAQHPINSQEGAPAKDTVLKQLDANDKKATETTSRTKRKAAETPLVDNDEPSVQKSPEPTALPSTETDALKSYNSHLKLAPNPVTATPVASGPKEKKKPVTIKLRLPAGALNNTAYSMPLTDVAASPAKVVPVGLFKRAADVPSTETQSADECILPDDDDIRISTEPVPVAPPTVVPPPPTLLPAPPTLIPAPPPRIAPPIPPTVHRQTAGLRLAAPPVQVYSAPETAAQPARMDFGTIDITSDDDEPAPAPAPSSPVPISLTAVHPTDLPPHLRSAAKPRLLRKVVPLKRQSVPAGAPVILNSLINPTIAPASSPQLQAEGQYILIPASSLTQMPPVVPVALNKVQYHTQGPPQPHLEPAPEEIHEVPDPTTDVAAEQIVETTPETKSKRMCMPGDILRITKSGAIEVLNRKDIKDINTENEQRRTTRVHIPPPPPGPPVQTRTLRGSTEPTPDLPTPTKKIDQKTHQKSDPKTPTTTEQNTTAIANKGSTGTITLIAARPPSPSDIFKNVVHIEADNYVSLVDDDQEDQTPEKSARNVDTTHKKTGSVSSKTTTQGKWQSAISHTAKTPTSTEKAAGSNNSLLKPSPSTSNAKSSTSNAKPSISNAKPSTSTAKPLTSSSKPSTSTSKPLTSTSKPSTSTSKPISSTSKPSTLTSKPLTSTSKPSTSTSKPSTSNAKTPATNTAQKSSSQTNAKANAADKSKERILDLVDLTDLDYVPPKSAIAKKAKTQPNTIVGTSKSIILCSSGKAISKPGTSSKTPVKIAPKVDKVTPASKPDVKKRPAAVDNNSAKKKKTDKPMTLKDFDIDDIDDIIELD